MYTYQLQNYAKLDMKSGYLGYRLTIYIFKYNLIVLATKIGENKVQSVYIRFCTILIFLYYIKFYII